MANGKFQVNVKGVDTPTTFDGWNLKGIHPHSKSYIFGKRFMAQYKRHCYATKNIGYYKALVKQNPVTIQEYEKLVSDWEAISHEIVALQLWVSKKLQEYQSTKGLAVKSPMGWGRGVLTLYNSQIAAFIYPADYSPKSEWAIGWTLTINGCPTLQHGIKVFKLSEMRDLPEYQCDAASVKRYISVAQKLLANPEDYYRAVLTWYINNQ